jgi:hypothetical protein
MPFVPGPFFGGATTTTYEQANTGSSTAVISREAVTTGSRTTTVKHSATDDGVGGFLNSLGTVLYESGSVVLKVKGEYVAESFKSNYEDANAFEKLNSTSRTGVSNGALSDTSGGGGSATAKGGGYNESTVKEEFAANSLVARYRPAGTTTTEPWIVSTPMPPVVFDLLPNTTESVVPGSLQFIWMGKTYIDIDGVIYADNVPAGTIDYPSALVTLDNYAPGANPSAVTVQSLWTSKPTPSVASIVFQVPMAPVKPAGLIFSCDDIAGDPLIGTAGIDGMVTGDHMRGVIDYKTGLVEMLFGDYLVAADLTDAQKAEWWYDGADVQADGKIWRPWSVDPSTLRYNAVSYTYLPLDANILGIDPVRLPSDGRIPIFRPGYFGVLGHTGTVGPLNVSNGQTVDCGRVRLSRIRVLDAAGLSVTTGYTVDLDAGRLSFVDVAGIAQPVTIKHHIEDMAMISDVQLGGDVSFTRQLTHDFPAGSVLSSAVMMGDLRARITNLFDQQTWGNVWADAPIGLTAAASFNDAAHPITVTNAGALTERWAIVFTSTTAFQVIGEHVGIVAVGNTATDCAPLNPASGQPYLTIPATGWGMGWSAGNCLRIDVSGPFFPFWAVLTVQQGQETALNHSFSLLTRGDIDRP